MQLIYSTTSPYARKARMLIIEKGLVDHFEYYQVNTLQDAEFIRGVNPLGKIPALVLSDGEVLYDSPVICEFIDLLDHSTLLIPAEKQSRFEVLTNQALADGLLDAVIAIVAFKKHSGEELPRTLVEKHTKSIFRSLDAMESRITDAGEVIDLGQLAFAAAIGFIELRMPDLNWMAGRNELSNWFDRIKKRASFIQTQPVE